MQDTPNARIIWNSLVEAYHNLGDLIVLNLLWVILSIPIITAPAAAAGLYYGAHQLAHEESYSWRTFFDGFKRYFWLSVRWALVNLLAYVVLYANYLFYEQFDGRWVVWIQGIFLGLGLLWLLLQVFVFPLLLEQVDQSLRTGMRNSLVLYLKKPGVCLGLVLTLALIMFISTWLMPIWLLLTGSLLAFLTTRVTMILLKELIDYGPSGA